MRDRRTIGRRAATRPAGLTGSLMASGGRLWARVVHRPVDAVAIVGAVTAGVIIVVNAIFLQSGPHTAPFFANPASTPQITENHPTPAAAPVATPTPAEPAAARPTIAPRPIQPVSMRRNDPIADLIGAPPPPTSPQRVMAAQRVLAAYGYGQIKPTGVLDEPTGAAIERFEAEHKLPVTGRLSDRLMSELAAMIGHPLE